MAKSSSPKKGGKKSASSGSEVAKAALLAALIVGIAVLGYFLFSRPGVKQLASLKEKTVGAPETALDERSRIVAQAKDFVLSQIFQVSLADGLPNGSFRRFNDNLGRDALTVTAPADDVKRFRNDLGGALASGGYRFNLASKGATLVITLDRSDILALTFKAAASMSPTPRPPSVARPPSPPTPEFTPNELSKPALSPTVGSTATKPKVAIIVDDMGQSLDAADKLSTIDAPLAFSIIPFLAHTKQTARLLAKRGKVVMLHLPMESHESLPLGKGGLTTDMNPIAVVETVDADIADVPGIIGVNNHMGSKFTEDGELMGVVIRTLKQRNLFFIDSLTSPKSVGFKVARRIGVRTARRDIFLDNEYHEDEPIEVMVGKLIETAKRHGFAIAICHPHPQTIAVLSNLIPRIKAQGIEIVPITALLK